jgi:dihydrofolate reductase
MKATIFLGMSLDGFIARRDDTIDFLEAVQPDARPMEDTFTPFFATVDVLLMGRRTFDVLIGFGLDKWPYGDKPLVVLSRSLRTETLPPGTPPSVRVMAGEPAEVFAALAAEGCGHVYVDGGVTARAFLAAGLVTDLVVTWVPVLVGEGRSLWGPLPKDVALRLEGAAEVGGGMVQARYSVVR